MRSTPISLLEERLAALVQEELSATPLLEVELVEGGPVLDGAEALGIRPRPPLPPEACLDGVTDTGARAWAAVVPGTDLLGDVGHLLAVVAADLDGACRPVDDGPTSSDADPSEPEQPAAGEREPQEPRYRHDAPDPWSLPPVSDAVLLEAVAACERQLAALSAHRDTLAGVFAARRQAEAEHDLADARAASAADGSGRPWATRVRSTGPSELGARLGISSAAADALVERGLAAIGAQREVASAMAAGALQAGAGSWLLGELTAVHGTSFSSALEREGAARETALEAQRAQEDAERAASGAAPLTRAELRARAAADREQVEAEASAAATDHADEVTAQVRAELLQRATGRSTWPAGPPSPTDTELAELTELTEDDDGEVAGPTSRPTAGAGLGATRRTWKRHLAVAVRRADAAAAEVRAAKARAACSTQRWNEDDDQACLQLRGPVELIAQITAAMDARARRRQSDARAAGRVAAAEEGRPVDRAAAGTLDQHRIAALVEWATAALEISETSGVSGTWYPIARTAASKPSVSLVMPWTVLAGVSTVGAELAGYGPVGAAAALRIAADGLWRRVFADPATGAAVGVEEGAWRPSTSLARLVSLRWTGSTFPGSTRPVGLGSGPGGGAGAGGSRGGGQLDHVEPWAVDEEGRPSGGPTEATNLQLLAQVEHLLKQAGEHARLGHGWSVAVDRTGPPGSDGAPPWPAPGDGVRWTSPTGHTYRVSPQRLLDTDTDTDDRASGGLPSWTHRLLVDVLPAWLGWPPDGSGPSGTGAAPWSGAWAQDWASAPFTDEPPPREDTAGDHPDDHPDDQPYLFDDLPGAA